VQENTSDKKLYPREFAFFDKDLQDQLLDVSSSEDRRPFVLRGSAAEALRGRDKKLELLSQKASEGKTFSGMRQSGPTRTATSFLPKSLFIPHAAGKLCVPLWTTSTTQVTIFCLSPRRQTRGAKGFPDGHCGYWRAQ